MADRSKINVNFLKNDFWSQTHSLNAKLGDISRHLSLMTIPSNQGEVLGVTPPDCVGEIAAIKDLINDLSSDLNSLTNEVEDLCSGYEWAENYAMSATVNLLTGDMYTENSMGGGNSNTIRDDNIYASDDDTFVVKYIAIYADGSYKYNMILNDENKNQSIDTIIANLISSGVINENADIKLSMGVTKEQADGSLGDIGWLPQINYNYKDEDRSGITKTSGNTRTKISDEGMTKVDISAPQKSNDTNTSAEIQNVEKFKITDENGNEVNIEDIMTYTDGSTNMAGNIIITAGNKSKTFKPNNTRTGTGKYDEAAIREFLEEVKGMGDVTITCKYGPNHGRSGYNSSVEFSGTGPKSDYYQAPRIVNISDSNGNSVDLNTVLTTSGGAYTNGVENVKITVEGNTKEFNPSDTTGMQEYLNTANPGDDVSITTEYTYTHGHKNTIRKVYGVEVTPGTEESTPTTTTAPASTTAPITGTSATTTTTTTTAVQPEQVNQSSGTTNVRSEEELRQFNNILNSMPEGERQYVNDDYIWSIVDMNNGKIQ